MRISDWSSDVCSSDLWDAFGLGKAEGQVEVLHCRRRSALEQVVERGDDDQAAPVIRQREAADLGAVAAGDAADPRRLVVHAQQRLVGIAVGITRAHRIDRGRLAQVQVGGDRQAAEMRGDVRHELDRSEEHTSELQSLMRISYAVFCLKKKK